MSGIGSSATKNLPPRLLVVDDDPAVSTLVRITLEGEGYEVAVAESASEAFRWIERNGLPHLAIVDVRMPVMDGFEFARRVQKYSDLPVIMLTGVAEESAVVRAIDEIAEDYVTKPFSPRELAARVGRVIRRIADFSYAGGPIAVVDDWLSIDLASQQALLPEGPVALTPTESKILHILLRGSPRTITTDFLLKRVWPLEEVFEDSLRVHMHRLRRKIEPEPSRPRYLHTHRGLGYSFSAPDS